MPAELEKVTFYTADSNRLGLRFRSAEPYPLVGAVECRQEIVPIPGFNYLVSSPRLAEVSAHMPTGVVASLIDYINTRFAKPRIRNCHDFAAHMGGIAATNYIHAMQVINEHPRVLVQPDEIAAGDVLCIAHPGFAYEVHGRMEIDHSILALGEGRGLEVRGIGGGLAVPRLQTSLAETRTMILDSNPDFWIDGRLPAADDMQYYRLESS